MTAKAKPFSQFQQRNARDLMSRFLAGNQLPIATNDRKLAASMLGGTAREISEHAFIVEARGGPPKLFINAWRDDYRKIAEAAYQDAGYDIFRHHGGEFDVDHALPKSLGRGKFEHILMNPVSKGANRTFGGGIEKESKERIFTNYRIECASIIEILKICELAPATRGNLAEDCLVGIINARESGLVSAAEARILVEAIRSSKNNIVAADHQQVESQFDAAANELFGRKSK